MKKREYFILFGFALVLLIVVVGIGIAVLTSKSSPKNPIVDISPTLKPSTAPIVNPGVPPVSYKADATDKLIAKVKNHPVLSAADAAAKQKILSLLPSDKTSGIVYQSPSFQVEYLKSPDTFLIEIETKDISKTKADAVSWFESQGMSKDGICNLPVSFYLNFNVANELRNAHVVFSPLADGC